MDVEAKAHATGVEVVPESDTSFGGRLEMTNSNAAAKGWKLSKTGKGDTAMGLFDNPDDVEEFEQATEEELRKLNRKIDWAILPYITLTYSIFYIDKTTLSYAAIFGLPADLQLYGTQYSWLSSIFYVGFLIWIVPTNLLMQRFPVAKYLGVMVFFWGFFLILQAACNSFATLAVCRALAGAVESTADPSWMLVTQMWYTRREQPIRIGIWSCGFGLGVTGGGLLGYGIGHIKGALPSWKYEFIIIGSICCLWGGVIYYFLPDSPVTAPRFTDRERRITVERLRDNQTGVENKQFKWYQVVDTLTDVKSYMFFFIGLVCTIPNGGTSNFGTLIVQGFGFSTLLTTVLQIPYGLLISLWILIVVFLNDRFHNKRCLLLILSVIPSLAGAFALRYVDTQNHVARLLCYYMTATFNASFSLVLSLIMANTAGHTKKVCTNAFAFLGYCAGNLSGPFFYRSDQTPDYPLGFTSMVVCFVCIMFWGAAFWALVRWQNARRDRAQGVENGQIHHLELDSTAFSDMTDRENPNFRYIY